MYIAENMRFQFVIGASSFDIFSITHIITTTFRIARCHDAIKPFRHNRLSTTGTIIMSQQPFHNTIFMKRMSALTVPLGPRNQIPSIELVQTYVTGDSWHFLIICCLLFE
jgi:hypothetical protein